MDVKADVVDGDKCVEAHGQMLRLDGVHVADRHPVLEPARHAAADHDLSVGAVDHRDLHGQIHLSVDPALPEAEAATGGRIGQRQVLDAEP